MEKKVNISLPKGKEAKNVKFKVSNGKIEVIYDLEEKFEPKDGDFLVTADDCIFIYNPNYRVSPTIFGYYVGINYLDKIIVSTNKTGFIRAERYATEEEKKSFLDRIEKELHNRWNQETKKLEDIVWEPKYGEYYFYVNTCGGVSKSIYNTAHDRCMIEIGNAFETEEAAKPYADQIKEIFKNSKEE